MSSVALHTSTYGGSARQCLAEVSDAGLKDEWQEFILSRFGTDTDTIQRVFGVSERTARYWLKGEIAPRGLHVWHAIRRYNFGLDT